MSTQPPSKKPAGKPTIEKDNHDQNVGQREKTRTGDERGKPTIEPGTHDANVGQRGVITDDNEVE